MKHLSVKALFVSAMAVFALNAQAAESVYDKCVADGDTIIQLGKDKGADAARAYEQKTSLKECYTALYNIEKKYGEKTKARNPYSVMTPEDKAKWARLFDSIDAKQYRGTHYLMNVYYRKK